MTEADFRAVERQRLESLPEPFTEAATAALADLDATPAAQWGVQFLGELFYGATLAEAAAKAADFAQDVGQDAVEQLEATGARSWPLQSSPGG